MNLLYLLRPKDEITYISSAATVRQGLEKLRVHGYTAIPAVNKAGEYAGTVSEGDFLWAIYEKGSPEARDSIATLSPRGLVTSTV